MTTLVLAAIISMNAPLVIAPKPKPSPPPRSPPGPPPGAPGPGLGPPGSPGFQQQFSNMFDFIKYCAFYMHVFAPRLLQANEKCCASARKVNISLFCKLLFIPNTEKVFSPRNVARVAKSCNTPLPVGSRCGSYKVRNKTMIGQEQLSL
ncbi:hypothetical protein C2S52_009783 [Perilla frutescens var. hirtella]|nr:hypothetical protein C2S51_016744 [Perilla frutescens var. frutescens]KAH6784824.1 hypothetical protein C2S52_009783 [Perilla frutescens var. hirtella]